MKQSIVADKPATIEVQILKIISNLSPVGLTAWELKTAVILSELNINRPEGKFTSQFLGKKLRSMGFKRRISHGHSILIVDSSLLHALLGQYQININPLSPNQGESVGESTKSTIPDGISIYFGMCPECAKVFFIRQLEYLNIGRDHYCLCRTHQVFWYIGSNLFTNWRLENEEIWKKNESFLNACTKVEPTFPVFKNRRRLSTHSAVQGCKFIIEQNWRKDTNVVS